MAQIQDQDRFFSGSLNASLPIHLVGEGENPRIINGRFVEGAITNAIGFDEFTPSYVTEDRIFASPVTYNDLLARGDVQLVAPLTNIAGDFLVMVISGILFQIDLATNIARDVTPQDAFLPSTSKISPLSYLDNDGGVSGLGGYLVIYNYPNKSIFINDIESRLADESNYEVPPSRMGATSGRRMFIASGDNLFYASDPLGSTPLAPLTFAETLDPDGDYTGQKFTIGSNLDVERITNISRMISTNAVSQDFLGSQILVSTNKRKYLIAAAAPREQWENIEFITYVGSSDGIAGPLASTSMGNVLAYISTTGRIKTIGQDAERDTGLSETFLDDPLGQYLCCYESNYYHRDWYRTLDHSRSVLKFSKDRLYGTVYPMEVPAITTYGEKVLSPSHRALAVGSIDSTTRLGPTANIAWEGFYDWINPIGVVTIKDDVYIVAKDIYGKIRYYKENFNKLDAHQTTIYTRGYFSNVPSKLKSLLEGSLYFRRLNGEIRIRISYLVNNEWVCGVDCTTSEKLFRFSFRKTRCMTDSWSIPLKIEIDHGGCRFELESIRVSGEQHNKEK